MSILSLGYLRLRSPNLDQWRPFAEGVLGLMPTSLSSAGIPADALHYRWDVFLHMPAALTIPSPRVTSSPVP